MEKIKVLFLKGYFPPEVASSNEMFLDLLQGLSERKIDCEVVCPIPTRGIDDKTRAIYRKRKSENMNEHIHIKRFWLPKERNNTILRIIRYFMQNIYQLLYACTHNYDLLFLYSTPPTNGMMGGIIRLLKHKPFLYYLNDIFPDSLLQTKLTNKGSIIWQIGSLMERFTYKHCDFILTLNEDMKANLLLKKVKPQKISIVPTWVNAEKVHHITRKDNSLFDEFGIDRNKFIVTYAGNIGESQSVITMIEAARVLSYEKEILFVVIGDGVNKEECIRAAYGLDNIIFIAMQSPDRISEVYSLGDISTVLSKKMVGGTAMPSKSISILASGSPMIVSIEKDSLLGKLVCEEKLGYCVNPEDIEKFADVVLLAYENRNNLKDIGIHSREVFLMNYTSDVCVERIYNFIKEIVDK